MEAAARPDAAAPQSPPALPLEASSPLQPSQPFRTRHAAFQPVSFQALPGWSADRIDQAWHAFQASCRALARKPAWQDVCARSRQVGSGDDASMRQFFEREFAVYQIREPDQSPSGVITGYYEPLLNGSRTWRPPFVHPVYATPDDLLYLEARRIPANARGHAIPARIEGRNVVPIGPGEALGTGFYVLEIGEAQPDIRDRRLRMRVDGRRIVPYPPRAEIERSPLRRASVLAWVDDPVALYSMQIQGSGKIRLAEGGLLRVGYAEQNGQPFVPSLAFLGHAQRADGPKRATALLTRGLGTLAEAEDAEGTGNDDAGAAVTRGIRPVRRIDESLEVRRLIEALRPRTPGASSVNAAASLAAAAAATSAATPAPATVPRPPGTGASAPAPLIGSGTVLTTPPAAPSRPGATATTARNDDPSYVFFRSIPENDDGPIGALGVPLTAGRSVAVDPRTTPLGAPVFLSTTQPGRIGQLNRLMFAQDTGGAVRGAVRADYFWGFGPNAGRDAARMKEIGRMWLLLPRQLDLAALGPGRTRGAAARIEDSDAECVVPDPDFCAED